MLKIDLGGTDKGGKYLTFNIDPGVAHKMPDYVCDITEQARQLEHYLQPQSVDEARCIAVLEHLPGWNIIPTLAYWRSFMKPNAPLFIEVPDVIGIFKDYENGLYDGNVLAGCLFCPIEWQAKTSGEVHQWLWDEASLTKDLQAAGYHDIIRVKSWAEFRVDGHLVHLLSVVAYA